MQTRDSCTNQPTNSCTHNPRVTSHLGKLCRRSVKFSNDAINIDLLCQEDLWPPHIVSLEVLHHHLLYTIVSGTFHHTSSSHSYFQDLEVHFFLALHLYPATPLPNTVVIRTHCTIRVSPPNAVITTKSSCVFFARHFKILSFVHRWYQNYHHQFRL